MDSGNLVSKLEKLKNSEISELVNIRVKEFEELGTKSNKELFKELCFCLLTANFNAQRSIVIQRNIGEGFIEFSEEELAKSLAKYGHRFPNARAKYIVEARKHIPFLKEIISKSDSEARELLVKNVKGLGYKESSHFLRNIGLKNIAIVDFHIIDLLKREGLFECKKPLCKSKYLEAEEVLKSLANRVNLNLSELDLYLWFIETGEVLK